jgi:hypothetical protein
MVVNELGEKLKTNDLSNVEIMENSAEEIPYFQFRFIYGGLECF